MGAKAWFIAHIEGDARETLKSVPRIDRVATEALVAGLYPRHVATDGKAIFLDGMLNPSGGKVLAGVFPGLALLAHATFGKDHPSRLDPRYLAPDGARTVLIAMHSVVDWAAFAVWDERQRLLRSLSLSQTAVSSRTSGTGCPLRAPSGMARMCSTAPTNQERNILSHFIRLSCAKRHCSTISGFSMRVIQSIGPSISRPSGRSN